MSDPQNSMAAQHPAVPAGTTLRVAPTDGTNTFNTIRIPLVPVACWRLNDPAFAFDSSFVSPAFKGELGTLSGIVTSNPGCPAALFGHCDPAGSDALNKTLGDRRVTAIYATLTRQPDMWEKLYANPAVGDSWGTPAVQTILSTLADGSGNPYYGGAIDGIYGSGTRRAVTRFQTDSGLAADGDAGPNTRKVLFGAYTDWLCTADGSSAPFRMQPADFLGGAAAQPGGLPKMSLQSCGKFNPIVVLTSDEMSGSDKATRDSDDALNRRVLMFLFQKGTTVEEKFWPCPKVGDAGDGCKGAFWPDGEQRRQNGETKRVYKDTKDTMACRFYDRFARRSPCEGAQPAVSVTLRFFDTMANPLPGAVYRVRDATPGGTGDSGWSGTATSNATAVIRGVAAPATLEVTWGPAPSSSDTDEDGASPLVFTLLLDVLAPGPASEGRLKQQLNALGYPSAAPLSDCIRRFQVDYGLAQNGDPQDGDTTSKVDSVYSSMNPQSLTPPPSIYKSLYDSEAG